MRNAARHARQPGQSAGLRLEITAHVMDREFELAVTDNGMGLQQTLSNGQGLAFHSTLMAVVGSSLALETTPGEGTRVALTVSLG